MSYEFDKLLGHVGHKIVCVCYAEGGLVSNAEEVSIECEDCNEVLYSVNKDDEVDIVTGKVGSDEHCDCCDGSGITGKDSDGSSLKCEQCNGSGKMEE